MLEDESLPAADQQNRLIHGSGKLVFLKQLLPKLKERGHRVLLFSQDSSPPIRSMKEETDDRSSR
jgi:SNF2 family DNA or RNA helicase